jgi:NTE family protein
VRLRPDILVLGSGGVLGEAWMTGVLAGLEDGAGFDLRRCEYFVGTSAGAVVAARLAAGERPRRPLSGGRHPGDPPVAATWPPHSNPGGPDPGVLVAVGTPPRRESQLSVAAAARSALMLAERTVVTAAERAGTVAAWGATVALGASSPMMPVGLALAAPGGALARAAALRVVPRPAGEFIELRDELAGLSARFDGRLRVVAVARASGRRTVFGKPHAPHASVADAVEASCAMPWLVGPVWIDGIEYVDGGVWSPTNLDVTPAKRDTQVLCLSATAGLSGPRRTPTGAPTSATMWPPKSPLVDLGRLSPLARRLSRSVTLVEAAALRGRRAAVDLVGPDDAAAAAIGDDLMNVDRADTVLAAGYRQGLRIAPG